MPRGPGVDCQRMHAKTSVVGQVKHIAQADEGQDALQRQLVCRQWLTFLLLRQAHHTCKPSKYATTSALPITSPYLLSAATAAGAQAIRRRPVKRHPRGRLRRSTPQVHCKRQPTHLAPMPGSIGRSCCTSRSVKLASRERLCPELCRPQVPARVLSNCASRAKPILRCAPPHVDWLCVGRARSYRSA